MGRGIALNDTDRGPWLEILATNLKVWAKEGRAVLACSALKESYRQILTAKCEESGPLGDVDGVRRASYGPLKCAAGAFL